MKGVKAVYGLTGTILSDSFSDFLVTMNVVMPADLAPSLSQADFQRDYFKVPWSRFIQAWIEPIMNTRFLGILSVYYLVDVSDFYGSGTGLDKPTNYLLRKAKIVQNILSFIPGFSKEVFHYNATQTFQTKNPFTILSFVIYRLFSCSLRKDRIVLVLPSPMLILSTMPVFS